jgi:hypothetical protein
MVHNKSVWSVCSQKVTACFTSASVADRLPTECTSVYCAVLTDHPCCAAGSSKNQNHNAEKHLDCLCGRDFECSCYKVAEDSITYLRVSQHLTIRYYSCGGEYYIMRTSRFLFLCHVTWMIGIRTCSRCAILVRTEWILIKFKTNVSLTSHEGSDRGGNIRHTTLLWQLAELGWETCWFHVPDAIHPHEYSLGISSIIGWIHPKDTDFEQKWLIWKFPKDPQHTPPPHAPVRVDVGFCVTVTRE